MNIDSDNLKNGRPDEVQLTAYALNELSVAERVVVETAIAGSADAQRRVEEIRRLAADLRQAARRDTPPEASAALREAIEQRFKARGFDQPEEAPAMETKPKPSRIQRPYRNRRLLAAVVAAACLLVVAIPGYHVFHWVSSPKAERSVAITWPAALDVTSPEIEDEEEAEALPDSGAYESADSSAGGEEFVGVSMAEGELAEREPNAGSVVIRADKTASVRERVATEHALTRKASETHRPVAGRPGYTDEEEAAGDRIAEKRGRALIEGQRAGGQRALGMDIPGVFSADLDVPFMVEDPAEDYGGRTNGPINVEMGGLGGVGQDRPAKRLVPAEPPTTHVPRVARSEELGKPPAVVAGKPLVIVKPFVIVPEFRLDAPVQILLGPKLRNRTALGVEGRFPLDTPGTEEYDPITENEFLPVDPKHARSTFSVDVDTASYANVRRFLNEGRLPPPDAVRIEELINYFQYDYPPPKDEVPFSVDLETAQCPWTPGHRLVRIGIKATEVDVQQRGPSNLVFLLDVSGSMGDANKLSLVKQAMTMLVDQLTEDDRVAIVTYAGSAGVALETTRADQPGKIRRAIEALAASGSTHGSAGIVMAYDQAMRHFVEAGTNRVILCTDGDLNVGITDDDELVQLITNQANSGVFLSVFGFGTGNLKDSKLEKLADKGNGTYAYVDSLREARRVFVEQASGSLVTIAKDVKIQIEFNPAEVAAYRLIGYENRVMAAKDFADDKKDAGEIGAGHTVTALYELIPAGGERSDLAAADRQLKYQRSARKKSELTQAARSGELFTLALRYKLPDGKTSRLLQYTAQDSNNRFGRASDDFRFASAVAAFGMLLRGSQYAGDLTYSAAAEFAAGALGPDPGGYRSEFVGLVRRAGQLRPR